MPPLGHSSAPSPARRGHRCRADRSSDCGVSRSASPLPDVGFDARTVILGMPRRLDARQPQTAAQRVLLDDIAPRPLAAQGTGIRAAGESRAAQRRMGDVSGSVGHGCERRDDAGTGVQPPAAGDTRCRGEGVAERGDRRRGRGLGLRQQRSPLPAEFGPEPVRVQRPAVDRTALRGELSGGRLHLGIGRGARGGPQRLARPRDGDGDHRQCEVHQRGHHAGAQQAGGYGEPGAATPDARHDRLRCPR